MRAEARDAAAMLDMVTRSQRALSRVAALSLAQFLEDEDSQDIVIHCLEIVGEAANRVSDAGRAAHADIPWTRIIGMRNRLIHDYGNIDIESVWRTIAEDLPPLIDALRTLT